MTMAHAPHDDCPYLDLITALAQGRLTGEEKRRAERLLEISEPCRAAFRRLAGARFPTIPNYTILEQVGKGGFGVVYKAVHHGKERIEALKVLFEKAPIVTSYFMNEVHLVAKLRHPNIAMLHDAQVAQPPLYYTMEFIEGERLNEYLRSRRPPMRTRFEILLQVCDAISYAHSRSVVHRDIKPQNILIDPNGAPRLVDFGIGKRFGRPEFAEQQSLGRAGGEQGIGTVGYIAPEQKSGQPADARADIFSLGALLYYVVTGDAAQQATDGLHVLRALREREVSRADDLAAIIARCVEAAPERRYRSVDDLIADLRSYLAGRPVRARRDPLRLHQVARVAMLVLREYPYAVRAGVLALMAMLYTGVVGLASPDESYGPGAIDRTVMIAFRESTLQAIADGTLGGDLPDLSPVDRQSWRLLHGRLMEKLAHAAPSVVVWDYMFQHCTEFDEPFIRGIEALNAPVVVGAGSFDVNGEPLVCDDIRNVVHSVGTIAGVNPSRRPEEFVAVLGIQRGFIPPIPGLALAGFAAARQPDCVPVLHVDPAAKQLAIRYRTRHPKQGEPLFLSEADKLPLSDIVDVSPGLLELAARGALGTGDKLLMAHVPQHDEAYWLARTINYEDVLRCNEVEQLRRWFDGKAVIIGQMLLHYDRHKSWGDKEVYGCVVHADALDNLNGGSLRHPLYWHEIGLRACLGVALAGLMVALLPAWKGRGWLGAGIGGATLSLVGLILGFVVAVHYDDYRIVETGLTLGAVLTSFGPAWVARILGELQLRLAPPTAVEPERDDQELPSTVLAQTTKMRG